MTDDRIRHLLGIEDLSVHSAERVLDTAQAFLEVTRRPVRKVPALRGKTIINVFFEGRYDHPFVYHHVSPVFANAGLVVRQTKQFAKESVEISTNPNWWWFAHSVIMITVVIRR